MADEQTVPSPAQATGATGPRCPWCSAELPSPDATECPSCLATLVSSADAAVPGVTAIDVEAMLRGRREPARQRGGILGWISGEAGDETPTAAELKSVEAPSVDVRREMLRLEIEAERQRLEAEAAALALEDQLTNGTPLASSDEVGTDGDGAVEVAQAAEGREAAEHDAAEVDGEGEPN